MYITVAIDLIARIWVQEVGGDATSFDILSDRIKDKINEYANIDLLFDKEMLE